MRPLESVINDLCLKRLGRLPDLENPRGYNDLIQWLKLHDQRQEHITTCDKLAVRKWVTALAGDQYLVPLAAWHEFPCIAKCTHDSGSATRVRDISEWPRIEAKLQARLAKPYGVEKAEWAYQFVTPRIICEHIMSGPIVDFKFHCSHGKVRWVQVIYDRASGKPRETILAPDGSLTSLHMDDKMIHVPDAAIYPGDQAWSELTALAIRLARGWRYVRVDLYWSDGQPWFGELTYWPRAGCYGSKDEPLFGEILELDLTEKREPLIL